MSYRQLHSRLLGLPAEILQRIVKMVIGGQVLHVYLKGESGFYLTPCVAHIFEQQAWEDFQQDFASSIPKEDETKYHVPKPRKRHRECRSHQKLHYQNLDELSPIRQNFSIFSVCTKLSSEAFYIFWTTNTFSIRHWSFFNEFLKRISDNSKRTIRSIDLDVTFDHEPMEPFEPEACFHNEEIDIIDPNDLNTLSDLDSLNLSISSTLMTKLGFRQQIWEKNLNLRDTFVRDVLRLEALDIKRLNVAVYDDVVKDEFNDDMWPWARRTRKEKQALAKEIYMILTSENRHVMAREYLRIYETTKLLQDLEVSHVQRWEAQHHAYHGH